jgi:hypothetical protein
MTAGTAAANLRKPRRELLFMIGAHFSSWLADTPGFYGQFTVKNRCAAAMLKAEGAAGSALPFDSRRRSAASRNSGFACK